MTRWALVPEDVTDDMLDTGIEAKESGEGCVYIFGAMLAASPANALLSEILAARDFVTANTVPADRCNDLRLILDALAKLGPAL